MTHLPQTGFLRLPNIIDDPKATPPIPALIPISKSKLWADVKAKRFPAPVKLRERVSAWRVEDIRTYINNLGV